ncbi:MAG: DUF1585 domain-containing protein, partial [Planctomycetaceae bacterium]
QAANPNEDIYDAFELYLEGAALENLRSQRTRLRPNVNGRYRDTDASGNRVDDHVTFPGGGSGDGIQGLLSYLQQSRQGDFLDHLCRSMLSYALGRSLQLSDEPLIVKLKHELNANDFRFQVLIESIVTSSQFLSRQGTVQETQRQ